MKNLREMGTSREGVKREGFRWIVMEEERSYLCRPQDAGCCSELLVVVVIVVLP